MIQNNCPLCGFKHTGELLRAENWQIVYCPDCTNAWTVPSPEEIRYHEKDFHAQFPYREINDLPGQWKKATLTQADLLTNALSPGAEIFEIGCGDGLFLREIKRRGFRVRGIEPSAVASRRARESGLDVTCGYFPHPGVTGPFSAVVMIQVLEHIAQPLSFLREIGNVAAGGLALFVQTNWRGLVPRFQKKRWYAWVPDQHFWHFTPKGMSVLFEKMGWKILALEYSSLYHGNSLLSRIAMMLPGFGDQFHVLVKLPE